MRPASSEPYKIIYMREMLSLVWEKGYTPKKILVSVNAYPLHHTSLEIREFFLDGEGGFEGASHKKISLDEFCSQKEGAIHFSLQRFFKRKVVYTFYFVVRLE